MYVSVPLQFLQPPETPINTRSLDACPYSIYFYICLLTTPTMNTVIVARTTELPDLAERPEAAECFELCEGAGSVADGVAGSVEDAVEPGIPLIGNTAAQAELYKVANAKLVPVSFW